MKFLYTNEPGFSHANDAAKGPYIKQTVDRRRLAIKNSRNQRKSDSNSRNARHWLIPPWNFETSKLRQQMLPRFCFMSWKFTSMANYFSCNIFAPAFFILLAAVALFSFLFSGYGFLPDPLGTIFVFFGFLSNVCSPLRSTWRVIILIDFCVSLRVVWVMSGAAIFHREVASCGFPRIEFSTWQMFSVLIGAFHEVRWLVSWELGRI